MNSLLKITKKGDSSSPNVFNFIEAPSEKQNKTLSKEKELRSNLIQSDILLVEDPSVIIKY